MTVNELILINSDKVRRDSSLMAFYIEAFIEAFGYKPTCTGCTFSSDWNKLVRFVNGVGKTLTIEKKEVMSTFKLKKVRNVILAYKRNGVNVRKYDNLIDENFVNEYLTYGTDEQISERKKLFSVLPDALKGKEKAADAEKPKDIEVTETEAFTEPKVKKTRQSKKSKPA